MHTNIAVIYLARTAEPFSAFEAFVESYRKHNAGIGHDFILLIKGAPKPGHMAAFEALFSGIPYTPLIVPENVGYDIHAYAQAVSSLAHEHLCFLNSFAQVSADGWLKKLYDNLTQPGVGIAGASASFESLHNSYRLWQQLAWHKQHSAMPFALQKQFALFIGRPPSRALARLRKRLGHIRRHRPGIGTASAECLHWWRQQISAGGEYDFVWDFPAFPNPHIRTNVFMVRRGDLLEHGFPSGKTKIDCCRFESGKDGLTAYLRRRGLRPLLVGADGKGYELHEWPDSCCFRSGAQHNLLAVDNQTRTYAAVSEEEKESLRIMTWGGYRRGISQNISLLDIPFGAKHDLHAIVQRDLQAHSRSGSRLFSIVIPCRNRGDLAMQVVQMVLQQDYPNWEICIFDNASETPLEELFSGCNDPRIRLRRSDTFLPVTESWNNGFAMAKGDYVTMIGDDDGILPGFFSRLNTLADTFDNPELIFSGMLQFVYPGVSPSQRCGYTALLPMADFLDCESYPFVLDKEESGRSVINSLNVRRSFIFNMPAYTASRGLLNKMEREGKILRSPFPDYYYANIALSLSAKTVCEPRPLSFQGVSRVSFGFSLMNGRLDNGFKTLGEMEPDAVQNSVAKHLLPGDDYQSGYITTMAYVADVLGDSKLQPNYTRYRRIQLLRAIREKGRKGLLGLWPRLTWPERLWGLHAYALHYLHGRWGLFPLCLRALQQNAAPYAPSVAAEVSWINTGDYRSGLDIFDAAKNNELPLIKKTLQSEPVTR